MKEEVLAYIFSSVYGKTRRIYLKKNSAAK